MFKFLNKYKCIAIAGNNGAGKTTLTTKIAEDRTIKSFAHDLRDISSVVLGIDCDDLKKLDVKESQSDMFAGYTVREVMINLATCIRSMNDDYFVQKTLSDVGDTKIIIDDLRFQTEVNGLIKKYAHDEIVFILLKKDGEEYMGDIPSHVFDCTIVRTGDEFAVDEFSVEE